MGRLFEAGRLLRFSIVGLDNQVVVEVTGDRKLENGLVIPELSNLSQAFSGRGGVGNRKKK